MKKLEARDRHHLLAAEGWLGLGNFEEGRKELLKVSREEAEHPAVLHVCLKFFVALRDWKELAKAAQTLCSIEPNMVEGWLYLAGALHFLDRTREARSVLLLVVNHFPEAYPIHYGLATFCSRLGRKAEARGWWAQAVRMGGEKLRERAREDPDLQELIRNEEGESGQ